MGITLLRDLKGGEILEEAVVVEKNVLIPAGTILKSEYIDIMKTLGVETVVVVEAACSVEKPLFLKNEKKKYTDQIRKILENHIYGKKDSLKEIESLAKDVVEEIAALKEDAVYDYEERRADLYEHTIMTTALCILISKKLHLSLKEQIEIAIGSLLHDIGLRYITVNYVNQSLDEKSDTELFEFKKHTVLGYSALETEEWIPKEAKLMVLSHHERLDGSGYPLKQKNKEIGCKIIQVCDTFDCMVSGMECRRCNLNDALDYLEEHKGKLFEAEIVDALCNLIKRKE